MPASRTSLPPGPRLPKTVQAIGMLTRQRPWMERNRRRYGDVFMVRLLGVDEFVICADPTLIRQVFTAPADVLHAGTGSPVGNVLGKHSLLAIDEGYHLEQRKLLLPPFHGKRMQQYEAMIAEVAAEEIDRWPESVAFPTTASFMRITLRAILRAVFGATGERLAELEALIPEWVEAASRIASAPWLHVDLGPRSPYGKFVRGRKAIDARLDGLIEAARSDPALEERVDVLAMMVQTTHTDGSPMANAEIRDQLLTLLAAGHETTANTLAWALERLSRDPDAYARLQEEADAGGRTLRDSAVREVQRIRPVIGFSGRYVMQEYQLADWTLPRGHRIALAALLTHYDPRLFPEPDRFVVDRFVGAAPGTYEWIPFGGGIRRCIGAAFALMEMDVVLRTVLERVHLVPTGAPAERMTFRGVAHAPAHGGLATIRRRTGAEAPPPAAALATA